MTLTRTRIGDNEDGAPRWLYRCPDEPDCDCDAQPEPHVHVVATGAAVGLIELADGTTYDITDHYVHVESQAHADELHHHIGLQHERTGRLGEDFRHTECRHCTHRGKKV